MRILLTNDDGISRPGLKVLEDIAATSPTTSGSSRRPRSNRASGRSLTLTARSASAA
jgi:broad specificity polyphosphatase/5'/3'-nucleotidase SurE